MVAICSVLRDEADKWLPKLLPYWEQISDGIIALDDGSTDATPDLLQSSPKVDYYRREATPMWGDEAPVRNELWQLFVHSGADWGLWLDGDMAPASDPRELFRPEVNSVSFTLYDLWNLNPVQYRHDGYWQGHLGHRIWGVKNPGPDFEARWNPRGIHCGHLPANLPLGRVLYAPPQMALIHLAYATPEARLRKWNQYNTKVDQLSEHEYKHAVSIMDERVALANIPFPVEWL